MRVESACGSNDAVWAVFDSPVQNALRTLKYRRTIGIADALTWQLAGFVRSWDWEVDLLIPVPLGKN